MSSSEPEKFTPFAELLTRVSRELEEVQIPYMVFGGQAVLMYGEPRFTQDIDITLGIDPSSSQSLLQAVGRLGLEVLVDNPEEFLRNTFVLPVRDPSSGIRLDIVFSLSEFEHGAIARSREFVLGNKSVRFVALEDLIIFKTIAGRPRDLEDIRGLLVKNPTYDRDHVTGWLRRYDAELGEGFEDRFVAVEKTVRG